MKKKNNFWLIVLVLVLIVISVIVFYKEQPTEITKDENLTEAEKKAMEEAEEEKALVGESYRSIEYFDIRDILRTQPKYYYVGEQDPIELYVEKIERDKQGALRAFVHVKTNVVEREFMTYGDMYAKNPERVSLGNRKYVYLVFEIVEENHIILKIRVPMARR